MERKFTLSAETVAAFVRKVKDSRLELPPVALAALSFIEGLSLLNKRLEVTVRVVNGKEDA